MFYSFISLSIIFYIFISFYPTLFLSIDLSMNPVSYTGSIFEGCRSQGTRKWGFQGTRKGGGSKGLEGGACSTGSLEKYGYWLSKLHPGDIQT